MAPSILLAFFLLSAAYVVTCPFTKVEESFNVQAMHDLVLLDFPTTEAKLNAFDHTDFPGVVPRTFLGALSVSCIVRPLAVLLAPALGGGDSVWTLILCRLTLLSFVALSLNRFCSSVKKKFGDLVAGWWCACCFCQFHLAFYSSRPLPNTFALALVTLAFSRHLAGNWKYAIVYLVVSAVIFRCDTIILIGPYALQLLLFNETATFWSLARWGIGSGVCCLFLTVAVDSYFWKRWLWPEGEVLFFNTVDNKSSDWGTSPWHWYFTSAIARGMLASYFFVPVSLVHWTVAVQRKGKTSVWKSLFLIRPAGIDWSSVALFAPVIAFLSLYSFLPHKELRFILPVFPMLALAAAMGISKLWRTSAKVKASALGAAFRAGIVAAIACSFVLSSIFFLASRENYPGGHALRKLHSEFEPHPKHVVHIAVPAAMTGVSRFGQAAGWQYSKTENLQDDSKEYDEFTHLLTADADLLRDQFRTVAAIEGFDRVAFREMRIATSPKIYVKARNET